MTSENLNKIKKLYEISQVINSSLELEKVLNLILTYVLEIFTAEYAIFFLLDDKLNLIPKISKQKTAEQIIDTFPTFSKSVITKVWQNKQTILTTSAEEDIMFNKKQSIQNLQLKSIMCTPLLDDDKTILGAIYLDNRVSKYAFSESDLEILKLFSNQSVIALKNAKIYTELKQKQLKLQSENIYLKEKTYKFPEIIGVSETIKNIKLNIEKFAKIDSTILIYGSTGTGKELVARAIHQTSKRCNNLFVPINCGAMPTELLESELFGYEKGAFTGAYTSKKGLFEIADKGTIVLDEISETNYQFQVKLLRVLQDKEIRAIGSTTSKNIDVRIIASTNKNLEELVKNGNFREDLYYRLNVISFYLPPLKERKEDIPYLVEHYLKYFAKRLECKEKGITTQAMDILLNYSWPGNIRELCNVIERALLTEENDNITPANIFIKSFSTDTSDITNSRLENRKLELEYLLSSNLSFQEIKNLIEQKFIKEKLKNNNKNIQKTAEVLQISRQNLYQLIKKYNIELGTL